MGMTDRELIIAIGVAALGIEVEMSAARAIWSGKPDPEQREGKRT
jgi:hypothetical protein